MAAAACIQCMVTHRQQGGCEPGQEPALSYMKLLQAVTDLGLVLGSGLAPVSGLLLGLGLAAGEVWGTKAGTGAGASAGLCGMVLGCADKKQVRLRPGKASSWRPQLLLLLRDELPACAAWPGGTCEQTDVMWQATDGGHDSGS